MAKQEIEAILAQYRTWGSGIERRHTREELLKQLPHTKDTYGGRLDVIHFAQMVSDLLEESRSTQSESGKQPISLSSTGADKKRLIFMAETEELHGLNYDYLAHLAHKGRLNAQEIGGVWVMTPADVTGVRCDGFCYNLSHEG